MKKFKVQVDLKKEISSLVKELDDIGKVDFGEKITSYQQANPIFENVGQQVAEILGLEWEQAREYMLKRTKLVDYSKSLYKTALKKDTLGGLPIDFMLFELPAIGITYGIDFLRGQLSVDSILVTPLVISCLYPLFHAVNYTISSISTNMRPFPFYKSINMTPEPKEKFESSLSHEDTHLLSFKYGNGKKDDRKFEGLAHRVQFMVMDKKHEETGNDAYLQLKYNNELFLAIRLFCWNGMREKKPIAEIVDELTSLGVRPKRSLENYEGLRKYTKTRNPLLKYLYRRLSGVYHCEGYYKMVELERNYGSQVVRDVFEGRFDNDFKEKSF